LCNLLKFSHKLGDFLSSHIVSLTVCEFHERSSDIDSIKDVSTSIQNVSKAALYALTDHFLKDSSWPHNSSPRPIGWIRSAPRSPKDESKNLA
jgi:hypothetical protein